MSSSSYHCLPQSRRNSLAFQTPVLLHLLLYLYTYGGVDPFPPFLKMVAYIIAPKMSIIFLGLIRRGSFLECWRFVNVTAIHKSASSLDWENYLPIPITHILFKVFETLVSHKLSSFCEECDFLPAAEFANRKCLGCTDSLLSISHHIQKSLYARIESYIVQLDFSAAFDRVSHSFLLLKLKSIGVAM